MKSFFCALTFCAATAAPAYAQYVNETEHFELSLAIQYQLVGTWITVGDGMGIDPDGVIETELVFPRPDCLWRRDNLGASFPATFSRTEAFGAGHVEGLSSGKMLIRDNYNGQDWVQISIPHRFKTKTRDILNSITIRNTSLPEDAVDSVKFITDSGLLEQILQAPGWSGIAQLENGGGVVDLAFQVTNVDTGLTRKAVTPSPGASYATCSSPTRTP